MVRWSTLLSTGPTSAVQTFHQTSADPDCPHGGQTPGQKHNASLIDEIVDRDGVILTVRKTSFALPQFFFPPVQGPLGVWRSGQGKKASRKPLSSDLSVREAGNRSPQGGLSLAAVAKTWPFCYSSPKSTTLGSDFSVVLWKNSTRLLWACTHL